MERRDFAFALVTLLCATNAFAQTAANPLLAIDQHRTTVVERVVAEWGDRLSLSDAGLNREQLREMLNGLRADKLLAASLAGSLTGLRDVLAHSLTTALIHKPSLLQTKALGDSADDVVYTPVTPCRLVETRGTFAAVYQGGGAFAGGDIRNYTAVGGNGVCLTQLPAGLNPSALQLQVFGIPINSGANGDVEILPQGSTFGGTATLVYLGNILFTSASTTARINLANNQIGVQVRGGGANVAIDVVGYFGAPGGNGGLYFKQGGNAFGVVTAVLGTTDSQPLEIHVNNQRVMRYEPVATSPNVLGGHPNNSVGAFAGQTVAGGGYPGSDCLEPSTGQFTRSCANGAAKDFATISGGFSNIASGSQSTIGGGVINTANADASTIGGGQGNTASGTYSTIGGGGSNTANVFSTVAGGQGNTASGPRSTIGGGQDNTTTGEYGTIGGGYSNHASGVGSTVAGGIANSAGGNRSFAAGSEATIPASAPGSFLWSDSTSPGATLPAGAHDQFIVASTNGIGLYTYKDFSHGCYIVALAASWTCTSDRATKADIAAIEPRDVLARLVSMSITQWRFRGEPDTVRHIGPMAQDFRASFGLGHDDKGITGVDADGVALAAIQGLNAKLDERVAEQQREIADLRRMVLELRSLMELKAAMR